MKYQAFVINNWFTMITLLSACIEEWTPDILNPWHIHFSQLFVKLIQVLFFAYYALNKEQILL